jgi:protein O-GlcNAc transferase
MPPSDLAGLLERGIAQAWAGQHKAAIQIFRMVVKRGGGDAAVQFRLGQSFEAIGDLGRADEAYRAAIGRDPDLYPAYRRAADLALRGRALASRVGQGATAEQLRLGAYHYVALLGSRLMQRGAWEEAGAAFLEARALEPGDWTVHVRLGQCLYERRRFRAAEESIREAIRLAPGEVTAHYHLGVALLRSGRPVEAKAAWRHALTLDPSFAPAQAALAAQDVA